MLNIKDIAISFKIQQFLCKSFEISQNQSISIFRFISEQATQDVVCPCCGGAVNIYDNYETSLKDAPIWYGTRQELHINIHRYRCNDCGHTFTENIDFRYPGSRITSRAAAWIKGLLRHGLSIAATSAVTGIHWDTICRIHKDYMNDILLKRKNCLDLLGYKPTLLAVDEFAIHKGHTYATCVMDLVHGDVIWVGNGRSKNDFAKFFEDIDSDYLSDVKAVAMDMNASYNTLVEEHMPYADIVYDRYHMQAQYGRDVLGSVRLQEAREHLEKAREIDTVVKNIEEKNEKKQLKLKAKTERNSYYRLKRSRWTLLTKGSNLSYEKTDALNSILHNHDKLAVCYAMKEEMCRLFELHDEELAKDGWNRWFEAAKSSNIYQLVKFAELKEKRLPGLISHSKYYISTGKLEGLNNKIKVAKRIGYGFRNDEYFFTLIRYISLPDKFCSPNFP